MLSCPGISAFHFGTTVAGLKARQAPLPSPTPPPVFFSFASTMFCVFWVCEYLVCFSARGIPATGTALQTDYTQNVHNWELNWKAPSSLPCSVSFLFLVVVLGCGCDACTALQWMPNVRKILKCGLEKSRLTGFGSWSDPGPSPGHRQKTETCSTDRWRCILSLLVSAALMRSSLPVNFRPVQQRLG